MQETEIISKRTRYGKTYDMGNGSKRCVTGLGVPRHYYHAGNFFDVDLMGEPDKDDSKQTVYDKLDFNVKIKPEKLAWRYISQLGKIVSVQLVRAGDTNFNAEYVHENYERSHYRCTMKDVHKDVDLEFIVSPKGFTTNIVIHSPDAVRDFVYRVLGDKELLQPVTGTDATGRLLRLQTGFVDEGRELYGIRWDGTVIRAENPEARYRKKNAEVLKDYEFSEEPIYPVRIDPTVNETPNSDAYATYSGSSFTNNGYLTVGVNATPKYFSLAMRFPNITVPQGTTLTEANLTLTGGSYAGSTITVRVDCEDVNNASGVVSGDWPIYTLNPTTAKLVTNMRWNLDIPTWERDVVDPVQEVIDRAGWSSGNSLVIRICQNQPKDANGYIFYYDSSDTANDPVLEIIYPDAGTPFSQGGVVG